MENDTVKKFDCWVFVKDHWKVIGFVLLALFLFIRFRGCTWSPLHHGISEIKGGPGVVEVNPNSVKHTPKPTAKNPKPVPVETWKPKEGSVEVITSPTGDVDIKIQRFGLCFEPVIAASFDGELVYPAAGLRFFFFERWGMEAMASQKYVHLGPDFRIGNACISVGARQPYTTILNPQTVGIYASVGVFLK